MNEERLRAKVLEATLIEADANRAAIIWNRIQEAHGQQHAAIEELENDLRHAREFYRNVVDGVRESCPHYTTTLYKCDACGKLVYDKG